MKKPPSGGFFVGSFSVRLAFRTMKPIFVVIFVAFASSSTAAAVDYRVRESKAGRTELFVTLNLSDKRGQPKRLVTRSASLGLKSQIHSPRCANALLRQHPDGGWSVPASCDKIAWTVRAKLGVVGTVDVSTQATVKFVNPSWFLLSESTSLLKLADDDGASTIAFQGRTKGSSAIGATEI